MANFVLQRAFCFSLSMFHCDSSSSSISSLEASGCSATTYTCRNRVELKKRKGDHWEEWCTHFHYFGKLDTKKLPNICAADRTRIKPTVSSFALNKHLSLCFFKKKPTSLLRSIKTNLGSIYLPFATQKKNGVSGININPVVIKKKVYCFSMKFKYKSQMIGKQYWNICWPRKKSINSQQNSLIIELSTPNSAERFTCQPLMQHFPILIYHFCIMYMNTRISQAVHLFKCYRQDT